MVAVSNIFGIFNPDPCGFMIQFDGSHIFSEWLGSTHQHSQHSFPGSRRADPHEVMAVF